MTSKATRRAAKSPAKSEGKLGANLRGLMPFGVRLVAYHPVRVIFVVALAAAILAFPAREWALKTFGWSAVPLALWTVPVLYLLSGRPLTLVRQWQLVLTFALLAAAASGALGMITAGYGSQTGESLGGTIGVYISLRPATWNRFDVTTLEYAAAGLRVFALVIAATVVFAPRLSWAVTVISSRYTWQSARFTGRISAAAHRTWVDRQDRRRAEKLAQQELKAAEATAAAIAELNLEDDEEISEPIIHGVTATAGVESELLFTDDEEAPPWDDTDEESSTNPMDQSLVLRELPQTVTPSQPTLAPDIMSTAVLSRAASQFKWPQPRLNILQKAPAGGVTEDEIKNRRALIESTLADYGIDVTVAQVFAGPTVTMYGLKPGWQGTKSDATAGKRVRVDMILNREKDLALALASPNIRLEPVVPGESVVGIEVPNSRPTPVTLRSVMESESWKRFEEKAQLPVPLGLGSGGEPVFADLAKMPHTLIAGATGSGKSVCINAIITGLLMSRSPAQARMVMIDPKRVELTPYAGIPHLYTPVVVEADRAVATLKALIAEMMGRFRVLEKAGVKNIVAFNERSAEKMPYLVILVDELADLMLQAGNEVERLLVRLAQLGRATGVHLVVATQRPSVDVVTGLIKANFPSRISFAVMSQIDSRTVLDSPGGEKLLGRGDMLYLPID
ncbi:MAG: DNA translocase FtsK, partial [Chloroflexi bacterium]|nr:DNA translocase FtsK [Chloroflexota bacterium]